MTLNSRFRFFGAPLILSVPGIDNSSPAHWQSLWEHDRSDMQRVDLGNWSHPHRNSWVTKLGVAIRSSSGPIILCGHSLGCLAIAWWAALEGQGYGDPVVGALLVAPPDCDASGPSDRLRGFAPTPRIPLPFPSIVVASRNDPYAAIEWSRSAADYWGSIFVDTGDQGHINADSGIGDWPDGQHLLDGLIAFTTMPGSSRTPAVWRENFADILHHIRPRQERREWRGDW